MQFLEDRQSKFDLLNNKNTIHPEITKSCTNLDRILNLVLI